MKKILAAIVALLACSAAIAVPLDSWTTWSTAQPYVSKQVPPGAMIMRGTGTNAYYVLEVDPATGEIPVSLAGAAITIDYSGATGAAVPADAAFIGGTDPSGIMRGVSVTTGGVVNVTEGGKTYSDSARYNYAGGSVTTSAWTQVIASTAAAINYLCITDQSGEVMELGTGAAASETRVFLIARGFSGCIPLTIASGTRIAVKAVSATASTGDLVISGSK